MKATLTDHLACPRCGPPFGLILLAHHVVDRRVYEGDFGCPNCRDRFPVRGGFGDLRPPPRGALPVPAPPSSQGARKPEGDGRAETEAAIRLAAALGLTGGPGLVVMSGRCGAAPRAVAQLVDGLEVVAIGREWMGEVAAGVSAVVTGPRIPLRDGVARGVVVGRAGEGQRGEGEAAWLAECVRVLMPGGRVVLPSAGKAERGRVASAGLATLLDEGGLLVATVPRPWVGGRLGVWKVTEAGDPTSA